MSRERGQEFHMHTTIVAVIVCPGAALMLVYNRMYEMKYVPPLNLTAPQSRSTASAGAAATKEMAVAARTSARFVMLSNEGSPSVRVQHS